MRRGPARGVRDERGQSTVEFALVLPLVLVVVGLLAQIGVLVYGQVGAIHSAREVARVLAVDPTADPHAAVRAAGMLDPSRSDTNVSIKEDWVAGRRIAVVSITHDVPHLLGFFGILTREIRISARAAIMVE